MILVSPLLAGLFFFTAALYASVGFGGGSTYIALLALSGLDYQVLPVIALVCNIIVVTGGSVRFHLRGLIPWSKAWPIILLSVPAAWAGGMLPVSKDHFYLLLGSSLAAAAILLLIPQLQFNKNNDSSWINRLWFTPALGAGIGFLSGIVGIGGGIFLAPILLLTNWSDSRRIAATASIFILVNSISGLVGQIMKSGFSASAGAIGGYWPLFLAVLIGGQLGSYLASKTLPEIWIKRLTALLILYVAIRLLWQQFSPA